MSSMRGSGREGSKVSQAQDINRLLHNFETAKGRGYASVPSPPPEVPDFHRDAHATDSHLSSADRMYPATGFMSIGASSTRSSSSPSLFDGSVASYFTTTTAISDDVVDPDDTPYYCEFQGYTGCERVFGVNQFEEWIQHIAGDHLHYKLPRKSICWHCDDSVFEVGHGAGPNQLMDCFRRRMTHIARHLRGVLPQEPMRADFWFAEHIYQLDLIDEAMLEGVRSWHEMPECHLSKVNPYPRPTRESPSRIIVECARTTKRSRAHANQRRGAKQERVYRQ